MGVAITLLNTETGTEREGKWGITETRDSMIVSFDYEKAPIIGIYGNESDTVLNSIGFITYDLGSECQAYVDPSTIPDPIIEPVIPDPEPPITEPETNEGEGETTEEPVIKPDDTDPAEPTEPTEEEPDTEEATGEEGEKDADSEANTEPNEETEPESEKPVTCIKEGEAQVGTDALLACPVIDEE